MKKSNLTQTTNKPRILATMLLAMALTGCASDSGSLAPPSSAPSQSISSSGNDSPSEPSSSVYTEPAPESSTLAPEPDTDSLESREADTTEDDTTESDTTTESETETKETESKESETKETDETETKESKETGTKEADKEQTETTKEADPAPEAKPSDDNKPGTGTDKPDNVVKPTVTKVTATVSGSYLVGSTLSASAFKVTAYFSDGTVLTNPPGFTASPLTLTGESNVITVSYKGASTTVTVKAAKPEPETPEPPKTPETKPETKPETPKAPEKTEAVPVKMTATPTREVYYHGDPINFDTVTVTVTMSDGKVLTNPAGVTFNEPTFRAPGGGYIAYYKDLMAAIIPPYVYVCPDSDFSKEVALEAFKLQNEMRAEAGSPPLTWSDDLYEVAKKCAKICGDNETIDHSLTTKFRMYTYIDAAGYEQEEGYAENLSLLGIGNAPQFIAKQSLDGIKNSPGHYETAMYNSGPNERCAIAAYRKGTTMYISYIFHHIDLDY